MSIKSRQRVHAIRMKELNKKHIEGLRNQYKDRGDRSVKELQSDIGITKHYQKMFKHFGQNLDIQRCSFRTKFWITKYLSDISCYCMSNERRQYDESANIDWNCYIQEHIEVIKNKIFNTADNCKSIVAKSLHFRILTLCSAMTNDPKNNYLYALNRFKAIENSSYIFVDIQNYINTLSNLSWAAIDNEKYMEAEFYTKKLILEVLNPLV